MQQSSDAMLFEQKKDKIQKKTHPNMKAQIINLH